MSLRACGEAIFAACQKIEDYVEKEKPLPSGKAEVYSLAAEIERFELWTADLGLLVPGHGSLDYRLRGAEDLTMLLQRLLSNLEQNLVEVTQWLGFDKDDENTAAEINPVTSDMSDPSIGFLQEDYETLIAAEYPEELEVENKLETWLICVKNITDQLYRVAHMIRNSYSRTVSPKVHLMRQVDADSGIDFFEAVALFDFDYVRTVCLPEPELAETTSAAPMYLVKRIADSITLRRKQFAYWRHRRDQKNAFARREREKLQDTKEGPHQRELLHDSSDINKNESTLAPPSATVRSENFLPKATELETVVMASEYTPSLSDSTVGDVEFPPPPMVKPGDKFFTCVYCFMSLPIHYCAPKVWKAHLIHDLQPYICTYQMCKTASRLYDRREDWVTHEREFHRSKVWRCRQHPAEQYDTASALLAHLDAVHDARLNVNLKDGVAKMHEEAAAFTSKSCPLCSSQLTTEKKAYNHIAMHLERFALFSLPRLQNGDPGDENGSVKSNLARAASLDEFEDEQMVPGPFAFRYWEIKPENKWGHRGESISADHPKPPMEWSKSGFSQGWHGWYLGHIWPLEEYEVVPRRATSLIWASSQQCYWILEADCTVDDIRDEESSEQWQQLYFRNLGLESESQRGIWQLLSHGTDMQLDMICPELFDEFLPKNYFQGKLNAPVHFVGDLSLILGLFAICPEDCDNIFDEIGKYFFHNGNPRFVSSKEHNSWSAMDRFKYPGRALVMETGLITGSGISEDMLTRWERGQFGPMVSSHAPTNDERQLWASED